MYELNSVNKNYIRIISVYLILLLLCVPKVYASSDTAELKVYVEKLLNQGYVMFHDPNLSADQKQKKSSELIRSHLYLKWMAEHSLGRFKRKIPRNKINKFIKVYADFVVTSYSDLATNYSGEKAVFTNIKQLDTDLYIVSTEIIKPGTQSPIKVDYLIHKLEGRKDPYLVGDIITEGISILNSQQSEFNHVLATRGIDSLIDDLQKRINNHNTHQ